MSSFIKKYLPKLYLRNCGVAARKIKLAINMKPCKKPWGGGNQFVEQLTHYLRGKGHAVTYSLENDITHILLIKSWKTPGDPDHISTSFDVAEASAFKQRHPEVRCIHRINDCDLRKNTVHIDELIRKANTAADFTVFISRWLRDYYAAKWFATARPHSVILNGADSKIFYPSLYTGRSPKVFRIVTHHWSRNWMKGFQIYKDIDNMIYDERLKGFELVVIGRWPTEIKWRSAITVPPRKAKRLANLLRSSHIYITASVWEPSGMHHIEGAQCGLPLVYHEDGGGIVEFGSRYGLAFSSNPQEALSAIRSNYDYYKKKVLAQAPSGEIMCKQYLDTLIQLGKSERPG